MPPRLEGKGGSAKQRGEDSVMTLEAEVSALKVEEESDKRKLAALEIQSQVSPTTELAHFCFRHCTGCFRRCPVRTWSKLTIDYF